MDARVSSSEARSIIARSQRDPAWWVKNILGEDPWPKQIEILESVRDNKHTAVRSCHAAGKSWTASRTALWFLMSHNPSIVITTAPTNRQVRNILWKEIRAAYTKSKVPLGGRPLTQEYKISEERFAIGFTAPKDDPDRFQGFHSAHILVIVDEASGVSASIGEAIDSILSGGHARRLDIGNPTDPLSPFAGSFKHRNVAKLAVSAFDTPNFTEFGIEEEDLLDPDESWKKKITGPVPCPWLITPDWVADVYHKYGPESPYCVSRVRAQFPEIGEQTLIPLSWIEAAQHRTLEPGEPVEVACDVARFGKDSTVIGYRHGPMYRTWTKYRGHDLMRTVGEVLRCGNEHEATVLKVDGVGVGGGVVDRLRELPAGETRICDMNAGAQRGVGEEFENAAAEWYWGLRERFREGDIDIDETDEDLLAQLASIEWDTRSNGKIYLQSKKSRKKKGLPSPDDADALAMCFGKPHSTGKPAFEIF